MIPRIVALIGITAFVLCATVFVWTVVTMP